MVITYLARALQKSITGGTSSIWYYISRGMSLAFASLLYHKMNKPDVILGLLPLYTCQYYDVAVSNDKLNYRSIKGQYMAHQKGGTRAMRIDLKLAGSDQGSYLSLLQMLHEYGALQPPIKVQLAAAAAVGGGSAVFPLTSRLMNPTEMIPLNGQDQKRVAVEFDNMSNPFYTIDNVHKTFDIITKDEILFGMYLETLIYSRNVKNGKDMLEVHLLCRHYDDDFGDAYISSVEPFGEFSIVNSTYYDYSKTDPQNPGEYLKVSTNQQQQCVAIQNPTWIGILSTNFPEPKHANYIDLAINGMYRLILAATSIHMQQSVANLIMSSTPQLPPQEENLTPTNWSYKPYIKKYQLEIIPALIDIKKYHIPRLIQYETFKYYCINTNTTFNFSPRLNFEISPNSNVVLSDVVMTTVLRNPHKWNFNIIMDNDKPKQTITYDNTNQRLTYNGNNYRLSTSLVLEIKHSDPTKVLLLRFEIKEFNIIVHNLLFRKVS